MWFKPDYDMANFMSRRDESNPALWLATWAGKMTLGITRCVPQEEFPGSGNGNRIIKPFFDKACLVKIAGVLMDQDGVS